MRIPRDRTRAARELAGSPQGNNADSTMVKSAGTLVDVAACRHQTRTVLRAPLPEVDQDPPRRGVENAEVEQGS